MLRSSAHAQRDNHDTANTQQSHDRLLCWMAEQYTYIGVD